MACCGRKSYAQPTGPSQPQYDPRLPSNVSSLADGGGQRCPVCNSPMRALHNYSLGRQTYTTMVCTNIRCGKHLDIPT